MSDHPQKLSRGDDLRRQLRLWEVLRIQSHKEISTAFFSAGTKAVIAWSGEISTLFRTATSSASSLSRFTSRPATLGRTFSRFATSLYSSRISGVTSQTNLPFSTHCRRVSALGFLPGVKEPLKAEIPEITTDVSTTTLRPRRFWLGFNGDLWPLLLFVSVLPDRLQNLLGGDIAHLAGSLLQTCHKL